jgi:hypothetical protein
VLWRRIDLPGHELARLSRVEDGFELAGTALFASPEGPCELTYCVACDSAWRTSSARVQGVVAAREVDLRITADSERRWLLDGIECPEVAGALDVDLAFSPATNTLPIRRLELAIGAEAEVRAAWLRFPSLTLEPLAQVYRREGPTRYRYSSSGGRFARAVEVDGEGLVTRYPGLWELDARL